jgi:hypothetical protein
MNDIEILFLDPNARLFVPQKSQKLLVVEVVIPRQTPEVILQRHEHKALRVQFDSDDRVQKGGILVYASKEILLELEAFSSANSAVGLAISVFAM